MKNDYTKSQKKSLLIVKDDCNRLQTTAGEERWVIQSELRHNTVWRMFLKVSATHVHQNSESTNVTHWVECLYHRVFIFASYYTPFFVLCAGEVMHWISFLLFVTDASLANCRWSPSKRTSSGCLKINEWDAEVIFFFSREHPVNLS